MKVFISQGSRNFAHNLDDTLDRWIARHENEIKQKITGNQIRQMSNEQFSSFIRDVPRSALYDMREELQYIIADIKGQLTKHHRETKRKTSWVNAANKVKRTCGAFINAIQMEMARRSHGKKTPSQAHYFMQAAANILTQSKFEEIRNAAFQLMDEDES